MRILHVPPSAYYPFLDKGGPAVKVPVIAEGRVRRGHQVTVLTSWHGRPQLWYLETCKSLPSAVVPQSRHDAEHQPTLRSAGLASAN